MNGLGSATIDLEKELRIKIYPNITQDFLTLEINEEYDLEMDVFNVVGQKVHSFQ